MCVCERVCVSWSVHCTAERKLVLYTGVKQEPLVTAAVLKPHLLESLNREREREREIVDKCIQIPAVTS